MIAVFCIRLGWGLITSLLLILASPINPRFFRTHLLVCIALLAAAAYFLRTQIDLTFGLCIAASLACAFFGALVWMLEGAPGGRILIVLSAGAWTSLIFQLSQLPSGHQHHAWQIVDHFSSALALGTITSAMLIGHLYLIAPSMSMTPLRILLIASGVSLVARMALAAWGLWLLKTDATQSISNMTLLLLIVRWGVGFLIPAVLLSMTWETTRIRSTQSATGILYVVVIVCFLGELTSLLLLHNTHYVL